MEAALPVFGTLAGLAGENCPGLCPACVRDLMYEEFGCEPDRLRVLNLNPSHPPHLFFQRRRNQISISVTMFSFRKFP